MTKPCGVCGTDFEARGNKRFCGAVACAEVVQKRYTSAGRKPRRAARPRRDPAVAREWARVKKRRDAEAQIVHEQMEAHRQRWGKVTLRDLVGYMRWSYLEELHG